jgi:hypothetical protein
VAGDAFRAEPGIDSGGRTMVAIVAHNGGMGAN